MDLKQRVYNKVIERVNGRINVLYEGSSHSGESTLTNVIMEEMKLKMLEDRLSKLSI